MKTSRRRSRKDLLENLKELVQALPVRGDAPSADSHADAMICVISAMVARNECPEEFLRSLGADPSLRDTFGIAPDVVVTRDTIKKGIASLRNRAGGQGSSKKRGRPSELEDWAWVHIVNAKCNDPTLSITNISESLAKEAKRVNKPVPGYHTVRRALLEAAEIDLVGIMNQTERGGIFKKYGIKLEQAVPTSNYEWQIDNHDCDFLVMGPEGETVRPIIVTVVDTFCGLPMGWAVFYDSPKTEGVLSVLKKAILAKGGDRSWGGVVYRVRTDNGPEYRSDDFIKALKAMGIIHVRNTPHQSTQNAVIENHFGILEKKFGNLFPRFMKLSRQINNESMYIGNWAGFKKTVDDFMTDFALNSVHREFNEPRYATWYRNLPAAGVKWMTEDQVDERILVYDTRTIHDGKVQVRNIEFTNPAFATMPCATVLVGVTVGEGTFKVFAWHKSARIGQLTPAKENGIRRLINAGNILANNNAQELAKLIKTSRRTSGARKTPTMLDVIKRNSFRTPSRHNDSSDGAIWI